MGTVLCHQFIHTSKPGYGFVNVMSGDVNANPEQLLLLGDPVASDAKPGLERGLAVTRVGSPSGELIAVTHVSGQRDEFKRPFVQAHTIFVPFDAYGWLGADLTPFLTRYTTSPGDITSSNQLLPIELAIDVQKTPQVQGVDLDLIARLLPSSEDLAKLITALLLSARTTLRLTCTPGETIELAASLLRLVPRGLNPLEVTTFQPRTELANRYELTMLSAGSATPMKGTIVEVAHGIETKSEIRPFAEAIVDRRLEEVVRLKQTIMHDYTLMHHLDLSRKAIQTKQWDAAEGQLKQLGNYMSSASSGVSKLAFQDSQRESASLSLDIAVGKQDDIAVLKRLKEASQEPATLSAADIRHYLDKTMKDESINPQFKSRLAAGFIREKVSAQWLPDEIATVLLKTPPIELFMKNAIEVSEVIRLLHDSASGQPKAGKRHEDFVTWLCSFDFEDELLRFSSSPGSPESFLIQLLNELDLVSLQCAHCAGLIIRQYFDIFMNRLTYFPALGWNPRLKTRRFDSVEQLQKAIQRSHVLDALENQIRRLGLKKEDEELGHLRRRIFKSLKS